MGSLPVVPLPTVHHSHCVLCLHPSHRLGFFCWRQLGTQQHPPFRVPCLANLYPHHVTSIHPLLEQKLRIASFEIGTKLSKEIKRTEQICYLCKIRLCKRKMFFPLQMDKKKNKKNRDLRQPKQQVTDQEKTSILSTCKLKLIMRI